MKKIILCAGIIACMFTACKDKNAYTLTGTFASKAMDGKMVYLQSLDSTFSMRDNAIDSVKVANGKFVFNGIINELPAVQFITVGDSLEPVAFIAEKGKIKMSFDSTMEVTIKGTAMNDRYQEFIKGQENVFEKANALQAKFSEIGDSGSITPEQYQEFSDSSKQLMGEYSKLSYDFIKPYIAMPAGQYFFIHNLFTFDEDQQKELISSASPDFQQLDGIQQIVKRIETKEATSAGKQFIDLKGFTLDGKEASLSDYAGKGKVVLVDFWASWCSPCRQAMPDVIKIYQKYKNSGFEIVGISLDVDKESWKKATKDLNITWPQFSNLKGWDEECAAAYGIDFIPQTVLIDKDGKIIERNLSEEDLDSKLGELLGSK